MSADALPVPIRVLTVDDHPMVRDGIIALIDRQSDMAVVGEAVDGAEAIARFRELDPDIVLMDVQMPGMSGLEAIEAIRRIAPDARILVLTTYPGDAQAIRAMRAGAAGYLLKNCIRRELLDAIRSVHAGRRAISPDVAHDLAVHALVDPLTEREVAVLRLVAEGHANKQIGWRLDLSTDTIKAHLKTIFAKLGVDDRTHAVTVATRRGYLDR
ncbi:response regulator transcription factor [Sphingomonas sp. AP4-R1]|uniref:response regulator n=1 Tax=Sphingomonas sp. AP4-R1 TaxID=2735134 RepID=UPI0014936D1B|nr:response regulator transcription factor [Sphingomonas sp. AP4-R1]QJU60142.1 response regulator transcription factor [Sphingomonas sp. AP4-R1]